MSYKEYWATKEIKKLGYKTKVLKKSVTIYFPDGDVYAHFEFKFEKDFGYFIYLVEGDTRECINDSIDFYRTYDEAVESCFYYFITRF